MINICSRCEGLIFDDGIFILKENRYYHKQCADNLSWFQNKDMWWALTDKGLVFGIGDERISAKDILMTCIEIATLNAIKNSD